MPLLNRVAARVLVRKTIDRVLEVLRDPAVRGNAMRTERFGRIRKIVAEVFDWKDMARRSLGVHWPRSPTLSEDRYVDLFQDLLADRYMQDVDRFQGDEKVLVHDAHKDGDQYRVDTTVITHSRDKVPISYFMQARGDSYRIHDFSVEE